MRNYVLYYTMASEDGELKSMLLQRNYDVLQQIYDLKTEESFEVELRETAKNSNGILKSRKIDVKSKAYTCFLRDMKNIEEGALCNFYVDYYISIQYELEDSILLDDEEVQKSEWLKRERWFFMCLEMLDKIGGLLSLDNNKNDEDVVLEVYSREYMGYTRISVPKSAFELTNILDDLLHDADCLYRLGGDVVFEHALPKMYIEFALGNITDPNFSQYYMGLV